MSPPPTLDEPVLGAGLVQTAILCSPAHRAAEQAKIDVAGASDPARRQDLRRLHRRIWLWLLAVTLAAAALVAFLEQALPTG